MWQKEKKDSSIVSLALLLALATTPMAATLVESSTLAQSSAEASTPEVKPQEDGIGYVVADTATNATNRQAFVPPTIKNINTQTLWWLLLPLSALGGLLLWWLLKRRPSRDGKVEATPDMPLAEASSTGTASYPTEGTTSTSNSDSAKVTSDVPPQVTERRASMTEEAPWLENLTSNGSAAGSNGAVTGIAPLWSRSDGKSDTEAVDKTKEVSTYTEVASSSEVVPQTTQRASYPQLPDVWEAESDSNVQPQTTEQTASPLQLPEVWEAESDVEPPSTEQLKSDKVVSDLQVPRAVDNTSAREQPTEVTTPESELPNVPEFTSELQAPTAVVNTSYPEQPFGEVASNVKPRVTVVTISRIEEPSPVESNWQDTTASAALAAVAPLQSRLTDRESDTKATGDTTQLSSYAEMPSGKVASDVQSQALEVTTSSSVEVSDSEVALDLEAPAAVVTTSYPEFLDIVTVTSDEPQVTEVTASFVELPTVSEVALDMVADAAELTADHTEEVLQTVSDTVPHYNQPQETEAASPANIAAGFGVGKWADIYGIQETSKSNLKLETKTIEEAAPVVAESKQVDVESSIVLTPRTPKWAYVFWNVSDAQKERLRQQGGTQLALRIYNVTNIDLSYQSPQLVQQYECEETTHNRYVAIPVSDRDYITEIGYITDDARWLLLARSATVRVKSQTEQDFWFVADAELIIHGATQPGSIVAIGGHPIKLKSDGTFHLRIPFTDSMIDYLMEAVAANGEQAKTIHMKFFQSEPPKQN